MRYKRETRLLFDLQQPGIEVDLAGDERLYLGEVVGVGDDHRGGDGEILALDVVDIELQEQLSRLDAVAGFDLGVKPLPSSACQLITRARKNFKWVTNRM